MGNVTNNLTTGIYQQMMSDTTSRINHALTQASRIQAERAGKLDGSQSAKVSGGAVKITDEMIAGANEKSSSMTFSLSAAGSVRVADKTTGEYLTSMSQEEFGAFVNGGKPSANPPVAEPPAAKAEPTDFDRALSAANQSKYTSFSLQDDGTVRVTDRATGRFLTGMSRSEFVRGFAQDGKGAAVDVKA